MRTQAYTFNLKPAEILWFPSVSSTNDLAKELGEQGRAEGLCVIADEQTAGRGRHGRNWHSTKGEGLYLSLLLRPHLAPERLQLLTLAAAVAVAETISDWSTSSGMPLEVDIKWPNDLLIGEKKVCGILVESAFERDQLRYTIIGIGCNLNQAGFPPELNATSLRLAAGRPVDKTPFVLTLLERLGKWYLKLERGQSQAVIDRWLELSSYGRGKRVSVTLDGAEIHGTTSGLTQNGALKLQTAEPDPLIINSGEITRLRE